MQNLQNNVRNKNGTSHQPANVQPQWTTMGLYSLINKKTKTLLDLRGGNMVSGSPVEGWPRNFNEKIDHQLWVITRNQADGNYRIMSYRAGTFLDLRAGKRDPKSQVVAYKHVGGSQSRFNQEWRISAGFGDKHYTIECVASNTFLEISDGANGASVTCSPRAPNGDQHHADHQLWQLERVSRTHQQIEALIRAWKPGLLGHLVQPFADDVQYFTLPKKLRDSIYNEANLRDQPVRKGTFDYGDFAIKAKEAVKTWARGRLQIDGYSVLFGIIYGKASTGPKAYNWFLSTNMQSLAFFDPQTSSEYTTKELDDLKFEPTFAVF